MSASDVLASLILILCFLPSAILLLRKGRG